MKFNDQQQAVVDWVATGSGSAIVLARAGAGKTFTLVRGVVRTIIERNLGQVALMAYNKSAGDEFGGRLKRLAEETGDERLAHWKHVQSGTVHSFGFKAVRKWAPDVKVDGDKVRALIRRRAEAEATASHDPDKNWLATTWGEDASSIQSLVSLAKQTGAGALWSIADAHRWYEIVDHHLIDRDLNRIDTPELVARARDILTESIRLDREVIDFDDMVLAPLVHDLRVWQFQWVLVDEAQDTNPARRALAMKLLRRGGRLVAVGDDRQAIYGFTGADADALEQIRRATRATILPLTTTFRCGERIVEKAQEYVPDIRCTESREGAGDVRYALDRTEDGAWYEVEGLRAEDGVLCRNVKPLIALAYQLIDKGIPCRVEGREIGEALCRIVEKWKTVHTIEDLIPRVEAWVEREVQKLAAKDRGDRAEIVEDQAAAILLVCEALIQEGKTAAADVGSRIRSLFDGDRGVVLTTIHKSKGREWKRVFLLYAADTLPSAWARQDWQLAQEDNLAYVAITRAEDELIFIESAS